MSNSRRGRGGGRPPGSRPAKGTRPGRPGRRARRPESTGPQVIGKRPSNPLFLFAVSLLWFGAAALALIGLHKSWKLIPVICFAGIGILYLRGAAGSYLRRPAPPEEK